MDTLSDDALQEIFLRLTEPTAIASCALICRRSAAMLAPASPFWVTKCKRDNRVIPSLFLGSNADQYFDRLDYRIIWRHNPYGRNLIKTREKHWQITGSFRMYQTIGGGRVICPPDERYEGRGAVFWYVTMGDGGSKTQTVDLWKQGVAPWILDELKPVIVASEWYDCWFYTLSVSLLASDGRQICCNRTETANVQSGWQQALHTFKNYRKGVRFVKFVSWEKGGKNTRPSVTLKFE